MGNQTGAGARGLNLHAAVNTEGWGFCGRRSTPRARRGTSLARRRSRTGEGHSAEVAAALDGVQVVGVPGSGLRRPVRRAADAGSGTPGAGEDEPRSRQGRRRQAVRQGAEKPGAGQADRRGQASHGSRPAAKAARQPRQATVGLRCLKVELPAKRKAPVELTHVREENPPRRTAVPADGAAGRERRERRTPWYGLAQIIFAS